ncbi:uncharacterized protein KQ657_002194 [Scheffersomyces spartinae]|uniref:K Homology domain-containing protein n=1 Tax=Scheffersomyces spartinae TaxID=45513 RepID=A0A9P7VDE3_9ASCO|nr:uncharacterized protein KQ657_002194 [Scheffersomyces spartinae]KAG7195809.1 hypothetical protein KQ657_002194 [Scheffersomyces spartinae]
MSTNILKRKNEDPESSNDDQLNKRVALDSEQLDLKDIEQEEAQTAPIINKISEPTESVEFSEQLPPEVSSTSPSQDSEIVDAIDTDASGNGGIQEEASSTTPMGGEMLEEGQTVEGSQTSALAKPVLNHREKENDPTYVSFRMFCPVKEASTIVGKRGEKIHHIREKANVRIYVSDNHKNNPERIILVKGPAENVARAFGLITRTILDEPEDEPASVLSRPYMLKILVPHPMVGFIIGKLGSKFREIEESSAAKLKATEQPLPYSTDRILSITGVGDAIHIAIYYISQVMLEHKDCLKKNKIVFYNPANYQHNNNNIIPNMMGNGPLYPAATRDTYPGAAINKHPSQHLPPHQQQQQQQQQQQPPPQMQPQNYNFQMMFQPAMHPQYPHHHAPPNMHAPSPHQMGQGNPNVPLQTQNLYTDEHGNNMIGDVITHPPMPTTTADKYNQDVFVSNENIGSVIGKKGNNIRHIREYSRCTYVKIEPDNNQTLMLGGGKGLTSVRKLTLTGSLHSINTAIYLINQRIMADKERNHQ